jgi:UDP-N-acetylmuramoylalanine--D-glutamate ligase
MEYRGKAALILGLGVSGWAAATYLLGASARVTAVDKNKNKILENPLFSNLTLYDENQLTDVSGFDFIVKSPGVSWDHPLLIKAKTHNIPITSEIELGLNELSKKGKTLFAITGSNGKTTTTLLTTHVLNACGKKAIAVGNVGTPLLSEIENEAEIFVVELSSYQLEKLETKTFDAAVILNITPNHLDRYNSLEEYAKAKFRIQEGLKEKGKLFLFTSVAEPFGHLINPILKEKVATFSALGYRDEEILEHDLENCSAAYQLCKQVGVSEDDFWKGFLSFRKPPHRIEFVRLIKGVAYINDSKATSCDAVIKAVKAMKGDVILIAGGQDKGSGYEGLGLGLENRVKSVLLIGESAPLIRDSLLPSTHVEIVQTLDRALKRASELAHEGQVVLFSPGCASFDQFRNYEHRGDVFKQLVQLL